MLFEGGERHEQAFILESGEWDLGRERERTGREATGETMP